MNPIFLLSVLCITADSALAYTNGGSSSDSKKYVSSMKRSSESNGPYFIDDKSYDNSALESDNDDSNVHDTRSRSYAAPKVTEKASSIKEHQVPKSQEQHKHKPSFTAPSNSTMAAAKADTIHPKESSPIANPKNIQVPVTKGSIIEKKNAITTNTATSSKAPLPGCEVKKPEPKPVCEVKKPEPKPVCPMKKETEPVKPKTAEVKMVKSACEVKKIEKPVEIKKVDPKPACEVKKETLKPVCEVKKQTPVCEVKKVETPKPSCSTPKKKKVTPKCTCGGKKKKAMKEVEADEKAKSHEKKAKAAIEKTETEDDKSTKVVDASETGTKKKSKSRKLKHSDEADAEEQDTVAGEIGQEKEKKKVVKKSKSHKKAKSQKKAKKIEEEGSVMKKKKKQVADETVEDVDSSDIEDMKIVAAKKSVGGSKGKRKSTTSSTAKKASIAGVPKSKKTKKLTSSKATVKKSNFVDDSEDSELETEISVPKKKVRKSVKSGDKMKKKSAEDDDDGDELKEFKSKSKKNKAPVQDKAAVAERKSKKQPLSGKKPLSLSEKDKKNSSVDEKKNKEPMKKMCSLDSSNIAKLDADMLDFKAALAKTTNELKKITDRDASFKDKSKVGKDGKKKGTSSNLKRNDSAKNKMAHGFGPRGGINFMRVAPMTVSGTVYYVVSSTVAPATATASRTTKSSGIDRLFNWREYIYSGGAQAQDIPFNKSIIVSEPTSTSTTTLLTYITPTRTVFTGSLDTRIEEEVLMTITDENYNFMFGYATQVANVKYYDTQKYLVARDRAIGPESKMIYVTRIPRDDEG